MKRHLPILLLLTVLQLVQLGDAFSYGQDDSLFYQLQIKIVPFGDGNQTIEAFRTAHPDVELKIVFNAPNFVLSAGECGTLEEIENLQELLFDEYPNSTILPCKE